MGGARAAGEHGLADRITPAELIQVEPTRHPMGSSWVDAPLDAGLRFLLIVEIDLRPGREFSDAAARYSAPNSRWSSASRSSPTWVATSWRIAARVPTRSALRDRES